MMEETLDKKLEDRLVEVVSNWLTYIDGEVYSDLARKSVRRNVHDNRTALNLIRTSRQNPEKVTDLLIDNLYYKEIGYPINRSKKRTKAPTRISTKKCKCK
jgi:hypothetical protein